MGGIKWAIFYYFITSLTLILTKVVCLYQTDSNLEQSSIIPSRAESCPFWDDENRYFCIFCCLCLRIFCCLCLCSFVFPHCSRNPSWFSESFSHELLQPWENSLITWVWMCLVGIFFFSSLLFRLFLIYSPELSSQAGPLSAKWVECSLLAVLLHWTWLTFWIKSVFLGF